MVEPTCAKLQKMKMAGKPVRYIQLDNVGENVKLQERCDSAAWKLGIQFEFTAHDTPQQNHLAELAFTVIANRGRAMMHEANLPLNMRYQLWHEAFKTASLLDGLQVIELNGVRATRFVHWNGKNPDFAKHLRTWGEAGTVKVKSIATPKIADRGVHCIFVGYALDHAGNVYRMYNLKTKRVHITRDVIWLK